MGDLTRLLRLRAKLKSHAPKFIRNESWRLKRVKPSWRRARGLDNKVRKKIRGRIASPNVGYRAPRQVRYLHASGFQEVVVHNLTELEKVNPRKQIIKIAHAIGRKKRVSLQDRADELNILILNRTRILLPGEELLLEEGRGFEREEGAAKEEDEEEMSEKEESSEDLDSSETDKESEE